MEPWKKIIYILSIFGAIIPLNLSSQDLVLQAPSYDDLAKNEVNQILAFDHPVSILPTNSGDWQQDAQQHNWRYSIQSENAKGIGAYLSHLSLKKGERLLIYDHRKHIVEDLHGPLLINDGKLIHPTNSNTLNFVLYAKNPLESQLKITEVSHYYFPPVYSSQRDFGDSEYCMINANCEEGDNWNDQKKGVVRIVTYNQGLRYACTGSLINNTKQDCDPLLLTAGHCSNEAEVDDYRKWIYIIDYTSSGCSTPSSEPTLHILTGSDLLARGGIAASDGSDFLLVRLKESPRDEGFDVFFNGWNRLDRAPKSGVLLHNPSGDIRKISTFRSPATSSGWNGSGLPSHWRLSWVSTANGWSVTEPGSSGAPLFNEHGYIVGALSGGTSDCNDPSSYDLIGKLSYSWDQNGPAPADRLIDWLDPLGTGIDSIPGIYDPQEAIGSIREPSCQTTANFLPSVANFRQYKASGGYVAGNNDFAPQELAEYFPNYLADHLIVTQIDIQAEATSMSSDEELSINIYRAENNLPGESIWSTTAQLSDFADGMESISIDDPIFPGSGFFVGISLPTQNGNQLSVFTPGNETSNLNSAWVKTDEGDWELLDAQFWARLYPVLSLAITLETCNLLDPFNDIFALDPNMINEDLKLSLGFTRATDFELEIFNMRGQRVYHESKSASYGTYVQEAFTRPGLYIARYTKGDGEVKVKKFVSLGGALPKE